MFGAVYEIIKRILLFQQLAIFIPVASQLFASTDMRNCKNKTSIQKADAAVRKNGLHAVAV